jgi:U3 small nucleolar RNA-associated protein 21
VKERRVLSTTQLDTESPISIITHPATYINKFLIGYENGKLELWNCNRQATIHTFQSHIKFFANKSSRQGLRKASFDGDNMDTDLDLSSVSVPAVTALEQSPACDVISVGFESGDILLINLKMDKVLFSFLQDGGAVTSFAFRTDAQSTKFPFLASSSADGRVFIWNLGTRRDAADNDMDSDNEDNEPKKPKLERKLQYVMEEAHMRRVSKLHFLHGEPILISSSMDNSIKMWIFDAPDGTARLLRSRSGHAGTPTKIRYYGGITNGSAADNADANSCELLSCGDDRTIRLFNTALESHNMEMSQKTVLKKQQLLRRNQRLPQCVGFDVSEARERNWGNMATIHTNCCDTYVWRYKHRTVTEMVLRQPHWKHSELHRDHDNRQTHSTAVCLSACGNYCVVGSRGGVVFLYNIQSGLSNGAFPAESAAELLSRNSIKKREASPANVLAVQKAIEKEGKGGETGSLKRKIANKDEIEAKALESKYDGHTAEVTGLFMDITNAVLVSCSIDGSVIFWDFMSHTILKRHTFSDCPQLRLVGFRDAGFVAVVGQDRTIRVFDVSVQKLVRRFVHAHSREITDIAFSPDGRRLLSSSLDCTVRVYDIPSGRCLNWLEFSCPVLSLTLSASGEYLCLTQADRVGIFMFIDKSLYETVHIWNEPSVPVRMADSVVRIERENDDDEMIEDPGLMDATTALNKVGSKADDDTVENQTLTVSSQIEQDIAALSSSATHTTQRGPGVLTMTTTPRAFWQSLFNLEAIKERNKPLAAPTAPKAAPFFLPTVHRGGSTSSFPTPQEAAQLAQKVNSQQDGGNNKMNVESNKGGQEEDEEAKMMREMASMSAWNDDEGGDWGDSADAEPAEQKIATSSKDEGSSKSSKKKGGDPNSRILKKNMNVARLDKIIWNCILKSYAVLTLCLFVCRCNLAIYLDRLAETEASKDEHQQSLSMLLEHMKTLPPPALDLELRALCNSNVVDPVTADEEGVKLLLTLLQFFESSIAQATDFELLQAYLTRTLVIYSETLLNIVMAANGADNSKRRYGKAIAASLFNLLGAHQQSVQSFRHLLQNNMCLLKLLSGLPM